MPLPAGFSAGLAAFTDANFWSKEPKVNGIWNSMFALNAALNVNVGSFVITPETVTQGQNRLRADLILGRIINANGSLRVHAVQEGKRANGDTYEEIYDQLLNFFTNSQFADDAWAIGARGRTFGVWFWDGNNLHGLRISDAGVLSRTGQTTAKVNDLSVMPQAQLQAVLDTIVAVPIVAPA